MNIFKFFLNFFEILDEARAMQRQFEEKTRRY